MDSLSATLAAVADPTRRSILVRLAEGPAAVGDLARPFRISQQAISKHLALLERARLVHKRREGRLSVCSLNPAPLAEIETWVEGCRARWEATFSRLDAVLDDLKSKTRKRGPSTRPRRTR